MEISGKRLKDLNIEELKDLEETLLAIMETIDEEKNRRKIKLPGDSLSHALEKYNGFELYCGNEFECFIWVDDVKVLYEELKNRYKI